MYICIYECMSVDYWQGNSNIIIYMFSWIKEKESGSRVSCIPCTVCSQLLLSRYI